MSDAPLSNLTFDQRRWFVFGALDACAKIYPERGLLVVSTRNEDLKRGLLASYGGHVEPGRWVLARRVAVVEILEKWAEASPYRASEIHAALYEMHRARKPTPEVAGLI